MNVVVFNLLLALVCGYALWRGGAPERIAALLFAGAALFGLGNSVLGAVLGVLQAQRIPDGIRGRVLSLQNACLQVAVPAGVGLAGVVAQWGSPVAAGLTLFAVWLSVVVLAAAVSRRPVGV